MLWKDVNIKSIQAATQEFIDSFKAAPKKIRLLPCARKLYTDLKNFQESLLLIVYLKDEALRDRFEYKALFLYTTNEHFTLIVYTSWIGTGSN